MDDRPSHFEVPDIRVLHDLEAARALSDPERRRLVEALGEIPDSASGLGRRLGESRQRLNYHLRSLEEAGILELHDERRKGNCTERVLRPTARRFLVDPCATGGPGDGSASADAASGDATPRGSGPGTPDRFSAAYLLALAARTIREVGALVEKARQEERRLATASLDTTVELARPADLAAFLEDLHEAVAGVVSRHHRPGPSSRPLRVMAAVHPRVGKSPDAGPSAPLQGGGTG